MGREVEETPKAKWTRYSEGMQSKPAVLARCRPGASRGQPGAGTLATHGVCASLEGPGPPTQTSRSWGQGWSEEAASLDLAVHREHTLRRTPPTFSFFHFFKNFLSFS